MALILLALLSASAVAFAHAKLARSDPADGAAVAEAPAKLSLWFDGEVEARFHRFRLIAADGAETPLEGALRADDPTCYDVALPPLGAGAWRVEYSVVSRDSHRIGGATRFVVGP